MVTADENITDQQNWKHRKLALVVLSTDDWTVIGLSDVPFVRAVQFARSGTFTYLDFGSPGASTKRLTPITRPLYATAASRDSGF